MKTITIIIPIYNAAQQLKCMIDCLKKQTLSDFEVLMINDGSTDASGEICAETAESDCRFRYICQSNQGVSAARNLGLAYATGDYITFLDADDTIPPDYLAVLYSACRDADIALCDVACVRDGREENRFTHPDGLLSQTEALNLLLERRMISSGPCAKIFRRDILEGLTFPDLRVYEDILFVRDAFCRAEKIAVTDRTEYRYIQNPHGTMDTFAKQPSQDIIRATEDLLAFASTRKDLRPEAFYITASHLMQYVIPLACGGMPDPNAFITAAKKVYRDNLPGVLKCAAFPWKEKVMYALFACGWLYHNKKFSRI